ncbi:ATP-dependent Clp protease, ATP-binding subunit ClpB, partial [methanotrophic bacterial endosymbiont of Bathymodiolus sp.]
MTEISRTALFGKLNNMAYKGVESATVFCKMRGNPYVELVHWMHQILQSQDSDLHRIIKRFELNPSLLARDFTDSLDRLPAGSTAISDFSAHVEQTVEQGWLYASLKYGSNQVRTGHLIVGIVKTSDLRNTLNP